MTRLSRRISIAGLVAMLCPVLAVAQTSESGDGGDTGRVGVMRAKLAANSHYGAMLGFGLTTSRAFNRDQQLGFWFEASRSKREFDLTWANLKPFGSQPVLDLRLQRRESSASDEFNFDTSRLELAPTLSWTPSADSVASLGVAFSRDEISNVPAGSSALIVGDAGSRDRHALQGQYVLRLDPEGSRRVATRLALGAEIGRRDGAGTYSRANARVSLKGQNATGGVRFSADVSAGFLRSNGGASLIGERYFPGDDGVRGFDYAGYGPRDLASPGAPALGGNGYVTARVDVNFPGASVFSGRLVPGLYADIGSAWGLDSTAGGPGGGVAVDDTLHWRSAIGVSVQVDLGRGALQVELSHPVSKEAYDKTRRIQFSYIQNF